MPATKKLGIFPWYSLITSTPEKSVEFFKKLVGLTSVEFEVPGMKTIMLQKGSMPFANVTAPQTPGGKSRWTTSMTVENVDTFMVKAAKMGAKANGPAFDLPTIGRAAVMIDPCGAEFMAFTPTDWSKTTSAMGMEEGMICWNDLMVNDPAKAMAFYGECMGWKFTKSEGMGDMEYYSITTMDAQQIGGIMKNPPEAKDMPPMWLPYMLTPDVKMTVKKVEELGGKVLIPPSEIPKTGTFSMIQDPAGCRTYLFTASMQK